MLLEEIAGKQRHDLNREPSISIEFNRDLGAYIATDSDSYDGAPDSDTRIHGQGQTPEQAVEDLADQLVDSGMYSAEEVDGGARTALTIFHRNQEER